MKTRTWKLKRAAQIGLVLTALALSSIACDNTTTSNPTVTACKIACGAAHPFDPDTGTSPGYAGCAKLCESLN